MIFSNTNRVVTFIIALLGVIFLVIPLCADSYSHFLQNQAYASSHEQTISCRATIALRSAEHDSYLPQGLRLERFLDSSCGVLPKYEDFAYEGSSGLLSAYNWVAQKVTFLPL